jgi:hypothetical protein
MTPFLFPSFLGIGYVHHKFVSTYRFGHKYDFMVDEKDMAIFFTISNKRKLQQHNLDLNIHAAMSGFDSELYASYKL